MSAQAVRPGIFRLRDGGFFIRVRVTDLRTGRELQRSTIARGQGIGVREAVRVQDQLRADVLESLSDKKRSKPHWGDFATSLLEAKVAEGNIKSAATRSRWIDTLNLLVPVFGKFTVDDLRHSDIAEWREQVGKWLKDGMPSRRKRDAGKDKIVHLSPTTANGWISILRTVCTAMKKRYELARDPAEAIEYFPEGRTYTREQPNALAEEQVPAFLEKMKERHPQHYAMVYLGFVTGARPSTLRPLRRSGAECDVLWEEGTILLRRSNSLGSEIMDQTKTALDQEIPLPMSARKVLRAHVAALEPGKMRESEYLFPSEKGDLPRAGGQLPYAANSRSV